MYWRNLEIARKTNKTYGIEFKKNGQSIDITNWTIYFTVKENIKDSDAEAKIKKDIATHSDPINGKSIIPLRVEDTTLPAGNYYYDIKIKDDSGNIKILISGRIKFTETVTQRD